MRRVEWEGEEALRSIYRSIPRLCRGGESRDVDGLMGGHLLETTTSPGR